MRLGWGGGGAELGEGVRQGVGSVTSTARSQRARTSQVQPFLDSLADACAVTADLLGRLGRQAPGGGTEAAVLHPPANLDGPHGRHSRSGTQAVWWTGDHELAESRHEDKDEDGHQLDKHPEATL